MMLSLLARRAKKIHVTDCEEDLRQAFRAFDEDDNGYMPISSLREIVATLAKGNVTGKFTEPEIDDICQLADPTGSDRIDFETFKQFMMRPF